MKKILISAALSVALFAGCGGVDKERLAQLTGDKSFEQVQAAFKSAAFYEKKDDLEIYKYYLQKNEDKIPGFDFENFSLKVESDYQKAKKELDDKLKKIRENLDKVTITQLKNEMTMYAFMMGSKPIDDYVKALEKLQKDKWAMIEADKKAEKEAQEARMRANESPAAKKYRESKEELKRMRAKAAAEAQK